MPKKYMYLRRYRAGLILGKDFKVLTKVPLKMSFPLDSREALKTSTRLLAPLVYHCITYFISRETIPKTAKLQREKKSKFSTVPIYLPTYLTTRFLKNVFLRKATL